MGRFIVALILGSCLAAYAAYHFDLVPTRPVRPIEQVEKGKEPSVEVGALLYDVQELPRVEPPVAKDHSVNSVVVPGVLQVTEKVDVASPLEGPLFFVGEEIPMAALAVAGVAPFLPDPCNIAKIRFQEAESVKVAGQPDRIQFVDREYSKIYRRPLRGQMVHLDQTLAMLNPIKALAEIRSKFSKVEAAEAESRAAIATAKEAKDNYHRLHDLWQKKGIAEYEYRIGFLTYIRHQEEAVGKEHAVKTTKAELEQTQVILNQHEIRSPLPVKHAIIKEIFKERGESVRPQDKIMELHSLDRFMAEGLINVNHYKRIKIGMPVTIEPTQEEAPVRVLRAHRAEITAIAFTRDETNPLIVSGSEDRSVLVWDRNRFGPVHYFPHEEPVRSLACSPRGAEHNLVVVGCADGTIHAWDLDHPENPAQKIAGLTDHAHRDAVTALAFSPDGAFLASGSADANISLWSMRSENRGKFQYSFTSQYGAFSPHQGAVTSLHFTPQCRLVSAARDNSVRIWEMHKGGVKLVGSPTVGRTGTVNQLGVSSDGRYMLFEQGKTLQMLSVDGGRTVNTITNPGGTILFDTVALFSPDSTMILTAGAPEGRMQLWSRPTADSRAFEVRQFVTDERSAVTCAAFSPGIGPMGPCAFAASGSKDGFVYLWPMPTKEEVENHRIRDVPLSTINPILDVATNQIRIGIEVPNQFSPRFPSGRLLSNRPVTIVID